MASPCGLPRNEIECYKQQDWILQAKQNISTDIWIWPFRVIRGQKYFLSFTIRKPIYAIYDFLSYFYWHFLSISTFRGQLRSKIFLPIESPYMPSYLTSIGTFSLSRTVFEIFDFKVFRVWPWPLTFRGHLRSNIFSPFESPYMTSYLTPIDTFSLSRTVFEIFDFKVFRVWPWPLTFRGHLRSKIFLPFESPYMPSYLTSIGTFSLSRTVFEIFDFKVFRVWPRPLTFGVTLGQKYVHHSKAHIWLPILLLLALSLYLVPFLRYWVFRVWPWPLTFRGQLRSKIFLPIESPYMPSYLTSIGTFSLSRTVFEIFDFKVFRIWPWPLTFRGHLRSNIFSPDHLKAHIWLPI